MYKGNITPNTKDTGLLDGTDPRAGDLNTATLDPGTGYPYSKVLQNLIWEIKNVFTKKELQDALKRLSNSFRSPRGEIA